MADTIKTLELSFSTVKGGEITLAIPDPKDDVTEEQIEMVMDNVISTGIFTESKGLVIEKTGARIVTKTVQEFEIE